MNELIEKLAEQAMIFSHETGGWRISTHVPNDFKEKFAKLIIKETMQIVANNLPQNTYQDVANAVLKHFKE